MHGLSSMFVENKALMIGAAAVAFFVAAVLILLVFRLAFGRRLRMANSRARQMRLGIVDAFDLDRQRQLVIIRRDNVEHLVMIGGPNDILIESQIIRTEARSRDKSDRDLTAPATKVMTLEPKVGIPSGPEPLPVAASDDHPTPPRAPAPPAPGPAPVGPLAGLSAGPRRITPAPPKPAPAAAPTVSAEPPVKAPQPLKAAPMTAGPAVPPPAAAPAPQPAAPPQVAPSVAPPAAGPGPAIPPPPVGADQPAFLRWPARTTSAPQPGGPLPSGPLPGGPLPGGPLPGGLRPAAKTPAEQPPLPPRAKQPAPGPAPASAPAPGSAPAEAPHTGFPPVPSMEGLESLEEEMAKLLGRGPGKP